MTVNEYKILWFLILYLNVFMVKRDNFDYNNLIFCLISHNFDCLLPSALTTDRTDHTEPLRKE